MRTCALCGSQISESTFKVCPHCGWELAPASPPPPGEVITPKTSRLAIAAFICGILFFILPAAIAAIVLGYISRSQIRRSGGRKTGDGMALAGLVLGYAGVALTIIALLTFPNFTRSRMAANEMAAANSLRTLNVSLAVYSSTYGALPSSLLDLQPSSSPSSEAASLVDPLLATGREGGYEFDYQTFDIAQGESKTRGYTITAKPVIPGTTGRRFFFTDQTDVIRAETNRVATADSPPLM